MSRTERVLAAALFVLSGLVACASPITPSIAACGGDAECPTGSRCSASACVENSPPTARFTVTGELRANLEVTLDASASRDMDQGDSIISYSWTITAVETTCQVPTVSGTTKQERVRFSCAGKYEVSLSTMDEMHAVSAAYKQTLEVTARAGSTLVEAGPDQSVDHVCDGTPLECRPEDTIQLSATPKNPAFQSIRWTVVPPTGLQIGSGTGRTVTFWPSATDHQPIVEIVTNGAAISGDWDFRVDVMDGAGGVLDSAVTRVSVGNRAPEFQGGPTGPFDHQYEPANYSYTVRNSFPVQVVDPDGDPLTSRLTFQHTGDGSAGFNAWWIDPSYVGFDVLAHTSAELIAPGIERTIVIEATDVNGASARATFPIMIGNLPPERSASVQAELYALHAFDTPTFQFTSTPRLGEWTDPDGDPLVYEVEADADCIEHGPFFDGIGALRLDCRAGGQLSAFVRSGRTASVRVSDPWTTPPRWTIAFGIWNRKPIVDPKVYKPGISCEIGGGAGHGNCSGGGGATYTPPNAFNAINSLTPTGVSDPDGDPLELQPTADAVLTNCAPNTSSCSLRLAIPTEYSCNPGPSTHTITFAATDGVGSTSATLTVDPYCR